MAQRRRAIKPRQNRPRSGSKGRGAATDEGTLWQSHEATALAALDFWNRVLILRMGAANDRPLDAVALKRLGDITRAVSWVESRHGTAATQHGTRDPMQCGHPQDAWWRQLMTVGGPGQDRFITGPGGSNFWAGDLPEAAESISGFPAAARVSGLREPTRGHDDSAFNPVLSYFWGVPYLVHKINTTAGVSTFECGDLSPDRLIEGAVARNGGGDPQYRSKIVDALALSGGLPAAPAPKRAARRAAGSAAPAISDVLATVANVLAHASRSRRAVRISTAALRLQAAYSGDAWIAMPLAAAAGVGSVLATLQAPFEHQAEASDELVPAIDAISLLLDQLNEVPSAMTFTVDLPLELGWSEGSLSMSLATMTGATHTLVLSIERQRAR